MLERPLYRPIHAQRAERWLGADLYQSVLQANHHWPCPLLAEMGGPVWAYRDSIIGRSTVGRFASFADMLYERSKGILRRAARKAGDPSRLNIFTSLSDIIAEASAGKQQMLTFTKAGTAGVVGVMNSLARVGASPAGQTTAAAFAAGESPTQTTPAGLGLPFVNPTGGDTLHLVSATIYSTVASQYLLLYDRFYQGNWNIATTPQTVSGTPTRYQDTTSRGAFVSAEVSTALGAGTPTVDVTYVDQDGNTAEATTSDLTIAASAVVNRFPHAGPDWQYRLNSGDSGVRAITNLALSAASTGNLNVFLGKQIAAIPLPALANQGTSMSFINAAFNLAEIPSNACLCLLELNKPTTGATSYSGSFVAVSG